MILRFSFATFSLIVGLLLPSLVAAASSQSFCKCICGVNSTIIPLDGTPLDTRISRVRPSPAARLGDGSADDDGEVIPPPDGMDNPGSSIYDPADHGYTIAAADGAGDIPVDAATPKAKRQDTSHDLLPEELDGSGSSFVDSAETPEVEEVSAGNSTETQLVTPKRAGTCSDCNRQFCLDHPQFDLMCGEAREEEVFADCFQRDSSKDQIVVYTFIIVTVGLLAYAAIRPWLERRFAAARERRTYSAVPTGTGNG